MPAAVAETISIVLLLGTLAFAVSPPRHLPEAAGAVPAAVIAVLLGVVSWPAAVSEARSLGPTLAFLAAVLVLAEMCEAEGVFRLAGGLMARASRGEPQRLLLLVFIAASLATAALSLDATVVLLTPVVFATATRLRARPKPHVYACAHLANSASLLLPVSNLTNLLAFRAAGVSFARFGTLMVLPWLVVIAVEYAVFRRFFAADLAAGGASRPAADPIPDLGLIPDPGPTPDPGATVDRRPGPAPIFALAVVGLTLLGFGLSSLLGVDPAWPAAIGALTLVTRRVLREPGRWWIQTSAALWAANPPFLAFVLALGIVVRGVEDNGVGRALARVLPADAGLAGLLLLAFAAALLANLVNNLPATLMMLPAVAGHGPGPVLAALIGVNVGPNLTYVGSLATLLWRRLLHHRDAEPVLGEFLRLGALSVPAALTVGVLTLWLSLRWFGG